MSLQNTLSQRLAELTAKNLRRSLRQAAGIDFASNDYLGLSVHPKMAQALQAAPSVGAGGSRLLRGNHPAHEELEAFAATFFSAESALFLNSGYDANLALLSTLPERGDAILYDERVHASMKEGARASFAAKYSFKHNDPADLEEVARRARERGARELWIAVESHYSMDGDLCPLDDFLKLARRLNAALIVDEAHATGIFGEHGRGLTEGLRDDNVITVHTCGKAIGAAGALIVGSQAVIELLINAARPFIFSTALPPAIAVCVRQGLALLDSEPLRRKTLLDLCSAASGLFPTTSRTTPTPILPVLMGSAEAALAAAEHLQALGFDVRAVRPPTVPEGTARLRISLSCERTPEELHQLAAALNDILAGATR
jgi:8-amino-7-oxononanoate synthase